MGPRTGDDSLPSARPCAYCQPSLAAATRTDDAAEPATDQGDATTARTDVAEVTEPVVTIGHEVGMQAPDFTVETVAGESFNLSDVNAAGSPVLLYFFATW